MLVFFVHLVLCAAMLLVVANTISGFSVDGWGAAMFAALILGVVNAFVRPLFVVLTLPLTLLTFGLFLLVINAFMLQLTAAVVPGFRIAGFAPALIATILLALLGIVVDALLGPPAPR